MVSARWVTMGVACHQCHVGPESPKIENKESASRRRFCEQESPERAVGAACQDAAGEQHEGWKLRFGKKAFEHHAVQFATHKTYLASANVVAGFFRPLL